MSIRFDKHEGGVIKLTNTTASRVVERGARFRGGLVFKAHRLLHHSTLGSRAIKKKIKKRSRTSVSEASSYLRLINFCITQL